MLVSMTGYGRATFDFRGLEHAVEIKSLNSKSFDLSLRLPSFLRSKEMELRNLLQQKLQRGKVDLIVKTESLTPRIPSIPKETLSILVNDLQNLEPTLSNVEALTLAIRVPGIFQLEDETPISEEENESFLTSLNQAVEEFQNFRKKEGEALECQILNSIVSIEQALSNIQPLENQRKEQLEHKLKRIIQDNSLEIDENRLYQELIFYAEKFDISEEKTRLKQHLDYFRDEMNKPSSGKKLQFISQEMGREINTIGSKANHFEIQKLVVSMKEELEKIKEQLMNVL